MNDYLYRKLNLGLKLLNLRLIKFDHRPSVEYASRKLSGDLIVCEIGVYKGINAVNILKTLRPKRMYLVDPYEPFKDHINEFTKEKLLKAYYEMQRRVARYSNIDFIQLTSTEFFTSTDQKFDFIYIDGQHTNDAVYQDLVNAEKRMKRGGVLAGHDIMNPDVMKAVIHFSIVMSYDVSVGYPDFWFDIE